MTVKKWITLAIYASLAIYWAVFAGPGAANIVFWFFVGLTIVHLLEFALVYRTLKSAGGSMAGHFLQTLVFGYVHWLPLRQQQQGRVG